MTARKVTFGNGIDPKQCGSSQLPLIVASKPLTTVQELLVALHGSKYFSMLQTTAGHISTLLKIPLDQLSIDVLQNVGRSFGVYLKQRRYSRNAVRSYSNFLGMLVRLAKDLGWTPGRSEVEASWQTILSLVPRGSCCRPIIHYAATHNKTPACFCDQDLELWGEEWLKQGRNYDYVRGVKAEFRKFVLTNGLSAQLPKLDCASLVPSRYIVSICSMPRRLRLEVEALLKWKLDWYAEGRPSRGRHRPITANALTKLIGRIYGFVTNIQEHKHVSSLLELISRSSIPAYVDWCINKRGRKHDPLVVELSLLSATLRWNPLYKKHDFTWLRTLIMQIEPDSESEKKQRKARKYVPYEALEKIPGMIRADREEGSKHDVRQLALAVHDELLFSWLLTLVWRQRNIRECRIGRNLFKAAITPFDMVAIPGWARDRMKQNPGEQFWQFFFSKDETKTKQEVRAILPRKLVPLLEDYLEHYRPALLKSTDPGTLFLNRNGRELDVLQVAALVTNLALRYAGKRVTPHLFRDIFAYYWLDNHPEDYLTLSKTLWHRNVQTTIDIYGCRFDESHGLRRVEEWLDSRCEKHESLSPTTPAKSPDRYEEDRPSQPEMMLQLDFGRKGNRGSAA